VQWVIWALARLGRSDEAEELYRLLNPIYHGQDPHKYRVEPYVMAADVYSTNPHVGRGGWTWYTGSGGWMYRLGMEGILGLRRQGDALSVDPNIPAAWTRFDITYRWGKSVFQIHVENDNGVNQGVQEVYIDGQISPDDRIPLVDDGEEHEVRIVMGDPS
jgi:cellobiose phosphorylase